MISHEIYSGAARADLSSGLSAAASIERAEKDSAGQSSHDLRALHGLRFLAAFCILFSHACAWLANFRDYAAIARFGDFFTVFGMPLFFVLSGFVIHYNYSRLFSTMRLRWAIVEFLAARVARIYPLFVCFFLVGFAVDGMLEWSSHHRLNLLLVLAHALTLTQSWVYIVIFGDRLVLDNGYGLSWSLSTEFFFYLLYVVLVLQIVRIRRISIVIFAIAGVSALIFFILIYGTANRDAIENFSAAHMNDHFRTDWSHSVFRWFFYYSPYIRMFEFVLGCLTAQVFALLPKHKVSVWEAALGRCLLNGSLIVLCAFALTYQFEPFGPEVGRYVSVLKLSYGSALPLAALIFCVGRYQSSAVAMALSTPIMVLLGDLSYSIYTVHTWTLRIFERPPTNFNLVLGLDAVLRIGLAIALTIILSAATYRLIEVPARALLRKKAAQQLLFRLGTREANAMCDGQIVRSRAFLVVGMLFAMMMVFVLLYQFTIVPHFSPYTR